LFDPSAEVVVKDSRTNLSRIKEHPFARKQNKGITKTTEKLRKKSKKFRDEKSQDKCPLLKLGFKKEVFIMSKN